MDDAQEFIENFLSHYATAVYDPVKAREYYLRNRELKGRKPGIKPAFNKTTSGSSRETVSKPKSTTMPPRSEAIKRRLKNVTNRHLAEAEKISADVTAKLAKAATASKKAHAALSEYQKSETKKMSDDANGRIAALSNVPVAKRTGKESEAIAMIKAELATKQKVLKGKVDKELAMFAKESKDHKDQILKEAASQLKVLRNKVNVNRRRIRGSGKA